MRYKSKKDPTLYANFVNTMESGEVMLMYETGPKAGNPFTISVNTLKRWWEKVNSEDTEDDIDSFLESIDEEVINEPYEPDVTPHVMEKPQSVIDYENIPNRNKKVSELPEFEDMVKLVESKTSRINENSKYVTFSDGKSTMWKKKAYINIYATEKFAEPIILAGVKAFVNKDTKRPVGFKITSKKDFDSAINAIMGDENNED